jgi:predicted DNA-binding ribbon-helix-helix protein
LVEGLTQTRQLSVGFWNRLWRAARHEENRTAAFQENIDEAQRRLAIQLDVENGASDGLSFERLQCIRYSAERADANSRWILTRSMAEANSLA